MAEAVTIPAQVRDPQKNKGTGTRVARPAIDAPGADASRVDAGVVYRKAAPDDAA